MATPDIDVSTNWAFLSRPEDGDPHLAKLLGCRALTGLTIEGPCKITPSGFELLSRLTSLRYLCLSGLGLRGRELAPIGRLSGLRVGRVDCMDVDDTALGLVSGCTELTELTLLRGAVTDAGLAHLSKLVTLERLYLTRNKVTGRGMKHLVGMQSLQLLDLSFTDMDDSGLTSIAKLRNLQTLRLERCPITDAGLAALTGHPSLRQLDLSGTFITVESIATLRTLKELSSVALVGSRISRNAAQKLSPVEVIV